MQGEQSDTLQKQLNNAYWERNQLVVALTKMFPSHLAKHPQEDKDWDNDWRTIVVVEIPPELLLTEEEIKIAPSRKDVRQLYLKDFRNQMTWHIHDSEVGYFDHLEYVANFYWDGHTTEEKYRRLRKLPNTLYHKEKKVSPFDIMVTE